LKEDEGLDLYTDDAFLQTDNMKNELYQDGNSV